MYHIPNDQRAYRSASRFVATLENCLQRSKLNAISVSALCREAGMTRNTFYRLFDNLTDVLRYHCDSALSSFLSTRPRRTSTPKQDFLISLKALMQHPLLLDAMLANDRADLICQSILDNKEILCNRYKGITGLTEDQLDYFIYGSSMTIAGYLRVWYLCGKKETAEEICDILLLGTDIFTHLLSDAKQDR